MKEVVLDIETIAVQGTRAVQYRMYLAKTVEAPGNYKDVDKINAYIEDKVNSKMLATSLDPNVGEICTIGVLDNGPVIFQRTDTISEKTMLEQFLNYIKQIPISRWKGKGIKRFDIPFIRTRALVHGLHELNEMLRFERYPDPYVVSDLEDSYWWPASGPREFVSQSVIADALNIEYNDTVTGADVADLWAAKNYNVIIEHCVDDIQVCDEIFKRIVPPVVDLQDDTPY